MNEGHLEYCASREWAELVRDHILPWAVGDRDLGDDVLEVGAGPGLTTDVLRRTVPRLTAVELDDRLARELAARLEGTNVEVVNADATALPFEAGRFSAATCFTMLHHIPSRELQDRMLGELCRVLRPAGLFVGSDSAESPELREFHAGDVYLPVDPHALPSCLMAAGFVDVTVDADREINGRRRFRFLATAPG